MKSGRFGSYVNHGKINATIPKGTDPASLTLDEAIELLKAKAAGGGVIGRLVGEHPDGGPVTVRDGRFGAYVNWGKVNATIPKGTAPDSVTLSAGSGADRRARGQACGAAAQGGERRGKARASETAGQGRGRRQRRGESEIRRARKNGSQEGRRDQAKIRRLGKRR